MYDFLINRTTVHTNLKSHASTSRLPEKMQILFIYEESLTLYGANSFFRRFSGHNLRYSSFRLPTHRREAHRKIFDDPFLK